MEKTNGQSAVKCDYASIYDMKTEKDIPYSIPSGMSRMWYIEFYTQCCHLLKSGTRYEICYQKLMKWVNKQ